MSAPAPACDDTRLARRLGLGDAVVLGLGAMIGAGIFAALGPAAEAGGWALLVGLGIAGVVALANAMASARLAAVYPRSGGTYVYGRERLGHAWGFVAGWAFVVGKLASLAAMALTVGAYAAPGAARPAAVAAVVAVVAVNYRGVAKTAGATRVILAVVLTCLAAVVAGALAGAAADGAGPGPFWPGDGARGVLQSAGLLFFAFAGYARIATLGEEVRHPARTIPRAIPVALGLALAVYAAVAAAALLALGPDGLARAEAPLAEAARAGGGDALAAVARVGAAVASVGVLVSLLAGVSRTMFAMADEGDLPRPLAAVHPRFRVPHGAELAAGAIVIAVVSVADLRAAIGFSAFAILVYYGIANACSLTLPPGAARWPRPLAVVGLAGCALLALTLPAEAVAGGAAALAGGAAAYGLRRALHRP